MEVIKKIKIKNNADLLFAKVEIKNFLKKQRVEYFEDLIFALMELGTNIIKHAKKGEIWLIKSDEYMIAALDKAGGIKDINWALQEGSSTKNTLGIGLSSLNKIVGFELKIFSISDKDYHGSIVLFKRKNLQKKEVFLIQNYLDLSFGGDFVINKGKFFILGDVNGHGKKAYNSAKIIKDFLLNSVLSCVLVDDIFRRLDRFIKENSLRGVVLSMVKRSKKIEICGVGNVKILLKQGKKVSIFSQKEGIIGEYFSDISYYQFDRGVVGLFSDGIEDELVRKVASRCDNLFLMALALIYFSNINDDKSVLLLKEE